MSFLGDGKWGVGASADAGAARPEDADSEVIAPIAKRPRVAAAAAAAVVFAAAFAAGVAGGLLCLRARAAATAAAR